MTSDEFAHFDAAYVLGALSEADRAAFEDHLITCAECRNQVEQLRGLTDLLAHAPAEAFAVSPAQPTERPDAVVALLSAAHARRTRRRWVAAAAATVAAACLILVTTLVVRSQPSDTTGHPVAMAALIQAPIHASADVSDVAWGTRITLTCTYDSTGPYPPGAYTLNVEDRAGDWSTLGTWNIEPGKVMTFTSGTAIRLTDIKKITIGTTGGTSVLQLSY